MLGVDRQQSGSEHSKVKLALPLPHGKKMRHADADAHETRRKVECVEYDSQYSVASCGMDGIGRAVIWRLILVVVAVRTC